MAVIHHDKSIMLFCQIADMIQFCIVSIHAENPIGRDHYGFGSGVFMTIVNMKEHLLVTAFRILAIFTGAVATPFFTIWLVSLYRGYQRKHAERFWME